MNLVDLDTARAHVRADPADDALLALYVGAAEEQVEAFLNRRVYPDADALADAVLAGTAGDDPIVVNKSILAAVLLLAGHLYANRENVVAGQSATELPQGAHALLWPHRVGLGI